jgi:hypothetical protein
MVEEFEDLKGLSTTYFQQAFRPIFALGEGWQDAIPFCAGSLPWQVYSIS